MVAVSGTRSGNEISTGGEMVVFATPLEAVSGDVSETRLRRLRNEGKSLREISDVMNLSLTTTARILKTA
jgi:hypothetical protein